MSKGLEVIEDLFKQIIGPYAATQINSLLFEPDNVEDRVKMLVSVFNRNPHLIVPFQTLIKSLNPQELAVPLEEHIRFFTTKQTQLWLIINLMNQTLKLKELALDEATGKLPGKSTDLLKFSTEALNQFGEESRYKDLVFAAGILFDFLFYLQKSTLLNLNGAKFDEPINQAFTKGVEESLTILKVCRYKSKLSLERFVPVAVLIRQISQICLCLLKPVEGPEFYKKLSTLKHTEPVKTALELEKFGVHTGILSTFITQMIPKFSPVESAMSIWGAPYLSWVSGQRDVHDLCGMAMLGASLKEQITGADFKGSGKVGETLPEHTYLDLALTQEVKSEAKI